MRLLDSFKFLNDEKKVNKTDYCSKNDKDDGILREKAFFKGSTIYNSLEENQHHDNMANNQSEMTTDKQHQKMVLAIKEFLTFLAESDNDKLDIYDIYYHLFMYIHKYNRLLYSQISIYVYEISEKDIDSVGTILSNIETIQKKSSESSLNQIIKEKILTECTLSEKEFEETKLDTDKALVKISDHISLAQQQYLLLKRSDEEYKDKFVSMSGNIQNELTRETNAQLITMVGIFTALAFIVFGGFSSLDNIFNSGVPLLKIIISTLVWCIGMMNIIFIFLYCVGKMTKLSFKANDDIKATVFQRYPVIFWTNEIMISMLLLALWAYYFLNRNVRVLQFLINFSGMNDVLLCIFSLVIIFGFIICTIRIIQQRTSVLFYNDKDLDE